MATYTIPEEVIGIPLYVPSAYDRFAVETSAMPNGDSCLRIDGNLGSYRAFQAAQTITPKIFLSRTAGPWACTFWVKGPSTDPGVAFQGIGASLFGVQTAA